MSGESSRAVDELGRLVGVLAEVVNDAPFGFAVFDQQLRFRFVNHYLSRVHDLAADAHIGRSMSDLFSAEHVTPIEPPIRDVLATGMAHRDHEMRLLVADSLRDFLINRYPLLGDSGAVVGVAVTVQDVTELRRDAREREDRITRARTEAEQRLSQVRRLASVGTWDIDALTGEVGWSSELYRLMIMDQGTPVDPTRVVHPDDRSVARYHWSELMQGRACTTEMRLTQADGGVITVVVAGEPVLGADERVIAVRGTVLDVTELRAAQHAAARARVDREHSIRLQNALLPVHLPEAPNLRVAVAYEPADSNAAIGGDFYDCFPLSNDRLAFAVGDVTGHDIESAALMSQVRAAITAYALEDPTPTHVVARVNRFVNNVPGNALVSLVYGIWEPGGTINFVNAGHMPPIIVGHSEASVVKHDHGVILGAQESAEWPLVRLQILVGNTLFCYTDGLVEQRGISIDLSINTMCDDLATIRTATVEALVRTALRRSPSRTREDDVCILAIHRTA